MKRETGVGLLWACGSGIVYGTITVGSKAVQAPPLAKATLSTVFAALALAGAWRGLRIERKDWLKVAVMAGVGGALAPALILYGLDHVSALHAGLLLTVELVATAALAFLFLGERTSARSTWGLVALLVAAVAVALAALETGDGGGGGGGAGGSNWLGILLVGLAALAWSVDNVVSTRLTGDYRPPQLILIKSALAAPLLAVAWPLAGPGLPATWRDGLLQAAIGVFGVGLSSVAFYLALQSIGAARTSAINVPVSGLAAAGGGALFLHEGIGWLDGVALLLVAVGVALLWEGRPAKGS